MIAALLPILGRVLDRVIPDKAKAEEAKHELEKAHLDGSLELMLGQLEVNKQEAKHESIFVAGWRPAVGWTCAFGLLYAVFLENLLAIRWPDLPQTDTGTLLPVLAGMLGLGGARSFEKFRGVNKER